MPASYEASDADHRQSARHWPAAVAFLVHVAVLLAVVSLEPRQLSAPTVRSIDVSLVVEEAAFVPPRQDLPLPAPMVAPMAMTALTGVAIDWGALTNLRTVPARPEPGSLAGILECGTSATLTRHARGKHPTTREGCVPGSLDLKDFSSSRYWSANSYVTQGGESGTTNDYMSALSALQPLPFEDREHVVLPSEVPQGNRIVTQWIRQWLR
jgi:hypothetical protein